MPWAGLWAGSRSSGRSTWSCWTWWRTRWATGSRRVCGPSISTATEPIDHDGPAPADGQADPGSQALKLMPNAGQLLEGAVRQVSASCSGSVEHMLRQLTPGRYDAYEALLRAL